MSVLPDLEAPGVSVAMVVRRPDPATFLEAIRSVLAQSRADFELIVVETRSDRSAAELLADVQDPRLHHHVVPAGTSLAVARNASFAHARAELVAILDADDVAEPTRLAEQAAFLDARPEIGVVGSAIRLVADDGRELGVRRYPEDDAGVRRAMRRWNPLAQPAVMVRRGLFEAAGGYADRVDGICEDYDLWCRLARAGVAFANLREPLTRYRIHAGSIKARQLRATLRDTIRIKRAHFGAELDLGDRLRILGERGLMLLPGAAVRALFLRTAVRAEGR